MIRAGAGRWALVLAGAALLSACEEGSGPFSARSDDAPEVASAQAGGTRLVQQDVEAPEVFSETDQGLWDGRPSLGGVWVAHPDVSDPERALIENTATGESVVGALFRRERENPGPVFQVSSDAADALGMLAGAPTEINVVALRQQEVPIATETPAPGDGTDVAVAAPEAIESETLAPLDDTAATAAAAIDAAEAGQPLPESPTTGGEATAAASPVPAAPAPAGGEVPAKPYIQIGIFSVEENANRTADVFLTEAMQATVDAQTAGENDYWRVIVGPAASVAELESLLERARGLGFEDAFAVTN